METNIVSDTNNDYNPFNVLYISLFYDTQSGFFPPYPYSIVEFGYLHIEAWVDYADGDIRGSCQQKWLKEQLDRGLSYKSFEHFVGLFTDKLRKYSRSSDKLE